MTCRTSPPRGVREGGRGEGQSPALNPAPTSPHAPHLSQGSRLTLSSGKRSRLEKPCLGTPPPTFPELRCRFQVDLDFSFPLRYCWLEGAFQGHRLSGLSGLFPGVVCGFHKPILLQGRRGAGGGTDSGKKCVNVSLGGPRAFDPPPDCGQVTSPPC